MTDRERLLRAFRQQPVDRIPVAPFIHVNYVKEFYGSQEVDAASATPAVYRHFGLDLVHRNCTPVYDAFGPAGPEWQMEVTRERMGRDETTITGIRTPRGDLHVRNELRWTYEYDAEDAVCEFPIKSEADFERMAQFQPPHGQADVSALGRARAACGDDGVTAPWIQGAFNLVAFYYRRLDDLVLDARLNPAFYHRMMEHFLARYQPFVQQLIDAGADVLSYGGNIANGKLVGPAFFREYVWPYEKRLIDFIQGQGVAVLYHNCGYARHLLPVYPGLGMRAYESLTPPPYGDTVLADAVRHFGASTTLAGGIDQLDLLRKGTAEEIGTAVRQVLDTVRGRCSFILGTTDYFNENTPHDAVHVLADAGRKYGAL